MSTLSPVTPTLAAELTRWRRDFHRHPELGFCEFRTAAIVAATLEKLGWQVAVGAEVMHAESRMEVPPAAESGVVYVFGFVFSERS